MGSLRIRNVSARPSKCPPNNWSVAGVSVLAIIGHGREACEAFTSDLAIRSRWQNQAM